jgi:hypothetical protein
VTYRERRERRAARLRGWADGREAKAETARAGVQRIADGIPMGQPILVGHHSEGRHRRDVARIENGMRATVDHTRKAGEMRQRAATIEAQADRAIYSDDPDAVERLEARIAELDAERDRVKAYNASCRTGSPDLGVLDEKQRAEIASLHRIGSVFVGKGGGFPAYHLSNLSGNIGRQRKRLEQLRRRAAQ